MLKPLIVVWAALVALGAGVAWSASVTDGIKAYEEEDFKKAYNIFEKIATVERSPVAQIYLGMLYNDGLGVSRDLVAAEEHYSDAMVNPKSSEYEKNFSRVLLGTMYARLDMVDAAKAMFDHVTPAENNSKLARGLAQGLEEISYAVYRQEINKAQNAHQLGRQTSEQEAREQRLKADQASQAQELIRLQQENIELRGALLQVQKKSERQEYLEVVRQSAFLSAVVFLTLALAPRKGLTWWRALVGGIFLNLIFFAWLAFKPNRPPWNSWDYTGKAPRQ